MERIFNEEEKIKRAEERYINKNNINTKVFEENKNYKFRNIKEKILFNCLLLINITTIILAIQNKNYIFTNDFLSKVNDYKNTISGKMMNYFSNLWNENYEIETNEEINNNIKEEAEENQNAYENVISNNVISSVSEMENDIVNLENAYSFVNPLKNPTITSRFGNRVSENLNVNGYHTGVDLASSEGTDIVASMQGIVTMVSKEGDYGNHLKIRCNNVITLYAHCQKIYVEEGQIVGQGQIIATVGSTGNSTGPHLHFEIRIEDRYVDPTKIIKF